MQDNRFGAVSAIVLRENQVLLVRHTYGGAAGKLLNPGGFLQWGETPFDAVKREILEETGVVIEPCGLLSIRCAADNWYMVFRGEYVRGEPVSDGEENSEALFMDCQEALTRADTTDTLKRLLKIALEREPLPVQLDERGRIFFTPPPA